MLIYFVIMIGVTLIIPALIVWFWRKRPFIALVTASLVLMAIVILPQILMMFQAIMIYGSGDPKLMAGGIAKAIVNAGLLLLIGVPFLAFVQFLSRRSNEKNPSQGPLV